jgi:hypothetical protein
VADTVRVGLDLCVLDALGSEALKERVEPSDGEGDPARACPRRVRLDEAPGVLVDLPENLFPDATVGQDGPDADRRRPPGARRVSMAADSLCGTTRRRMAAGAAARRAIGACSAPSEGQR